MGGVQLGLARRQADRFLTESVFVGRALDVGGGYDPLRAHQFPKLDSVEIVDWELQPQRDAHEVASYFAPELFDLVFSSHCLEHLVDPERALRGWWDVLKPGGFLYVLVPDFEYYEQLRWPSQFNGDHKHCWGLWPDPRARGEYRSLIPIVGSLGPMTMHRAVRLGDGCVVDGLLDNTAGRGAEAGSEILVQKWSA